jgi:hypothetical protein
MWIGCPDARNPGKRSRECGSVFVVRNAANLVVSTDFNLWVLCNMPSMFSKSGYYSWSLVTAAASELMEDKSPPLRTAVL